MRVTQGGGQAQFLTAVNSLEVQIAQSENNISSNQSFTTAAENPVAAGSVNNYNQALAQSQQYGANAQSAQTNLSTEDNALNSVQTQLQSLRSLALEANNGTLTASDRSAIAVQAVQIQNTLLSLANTQNGNGEYIFSGFASQAQAFSLTATGATYNGDTGQRQIQIAAGQTVADGDNGAAVFDNIKTGNGTFSVTAAASNTGQSLIGAATVADPTAYDGATYTIKFTDANDYQVLDSAVPPNVVSSGAYADGSSIAFKGVTVTLSGASAAGDTFTVAPSTNQSLFATVQNLVNALQGTTTTSASTTNLNNLIGNSINDIDQAITQTSNVRASVGGRLNTLTTALSVQTSQQTQLKTNISTLQGLDYAAAITNLTQQQTTLSAALQSFTLTQGLSLFKFLQ